MLKQHGIRISMDGKGRWRDHVFVERLWKSVKYEEVYLHAYDTVSAQLHGDIGQEELLTHEAPVIASRGVVLGGEYFASVSNSQ